MFNLEKKNIIITGGAGLMSSNFIDGIYEYGGNPIILENNRNKINILKKKIKFKFNKIPECYFVDITNSNHIKLNAKKLKKKYKYIDALVNNAARNPTFNNKAKSLSFKDYDINDWIKDCKIGLTGSILCTQIYGSMIAKNPRGGTIINISSDLGLISPDQRIYKTKNSKFEKPVSYSIIKSGLIGLTKFTSTYWADKNVRCNCICPGGIQNKHSKSFLKKINNLIPLGRMAKKNEYNGLIVFLLSDASSYLNGSVISADGGRTAW